MSNLIERAKKHVEKYKDSIQLKSDKLIEELLNQLEQREEKLKLYTGLSKQMESRWHDASGECLMLRDKNKQLQQSNRLKDDVIEAVKSLNLDKVEGYMLLGKSYKEIICEALQALKEGEK